MTPNIARALVAAQRSARHARKDGLVASEGRHYATVDELVEVARDAFEAAGLGLLPGGLMSDERHGAIWQGRVWRLIHQESGEFCDMQSWWPLSRTGAIDKAWAALDSYSLGYFLRDTLLIARRLAGEAEVDQRRDARTNVQSHGTFVQDDPGVVDVVTGPDNEGILDARPGQWLAGSKGRPWADAKREAEALDRTTPPLRVEDAAFCPDTTGEGSPALPPAPDALSGALSTLQRGEAAAPVSDTAQANQAEGYAPAVPLEHPHEFPARDTWGVVVAHMNECATCGNDASDEWCATGIELRRRHYAGESTDSPPHLSTSSPAVETVSAAGGEGLQAFVSELRADDKAMTEAEDAPLAEPTPAVVSLVASVAEKLAAKIGPPWRGEGPMCCTCGGQHSLVDCPLADDSVSEEEAHEAMRIAMEKEAAPAKAEYFRAMNGAMVPVVNYEVGDPAPRAFLADLTKPVAESGPLADDPAPAPKRRGRPKGSKNRPKAKPEEAA